MSDACLPRYLVFNKPYGVLSSFTDPDGRQTLAEYIPIPSVYAAGRLDRDSEGLLFLTSDTSLLHRITDPRYKMWKEYWVQVERIPSEDALIALRRGVLVKGKMTRRADVMLMGSDPKLWPRTVPIRVRKHIPTAWLRIRIQEGMNRQIRRMTAAVGYPTLRVVRVGIGPIRLRGLQPGEWRELTNEEVVELPAIYACSSE
ncbi:MAG: ribosomal large subunit pseudouridine synthase E [Nitrospirales bacterium]|nr:MAG: ribosomal large subunit pseudouridine synthase E [Nitrospirales bacterium]